MDVQIVAALIGVVGLIAAGVLGYWLGRRGFLYEQRFKEKQHKRDKLGEFLGEVVPEMNSLLNRRSPTIPNPGDAIIWWGHNPQQRKAIYQKASNLHSRADSFIPFFPNNKEVQEAIRRMGNIVGSYVESQAPSTAFDSFNEDWELVRSFHRRLEAQIMGEEKSPRWQFWK